jgi:hypothetical protein
MSSPGAGSVAATIIEEMILDASGYESGAQRVIAADNLMIASFQRVQQAHAAMAAQLGAGYQVPGPPPIIGSPTGGGSGGGGGYGGGLGGMFGIYLAIRGIREVEHAFEELGKKFIDFSENALKQYASFDTLQKSFEGIYGSSEKAAQMMTYLRDAAMTSAFHFKDLADAARGLSVAGLDVNRFLPIVQGFALALGHVDAGGLNDFVSILRRLQGGNTGVALGPRGIGRYGVSRNELEQYGATFDNKGHFTGTINEAFDAIEAVFKARISKIAEKVTASSEVVLSNWGDAIQQATIDAGAGIAQNLIQPIKTLTGAMNDLRQAGVFKDLFDTLYQIIDVGGIIGDKKGAQDILIEIGGGIVTLVEFTKIMVTEIQGIAKGIAQFLGIEVDPSTEWGTAVDIGNRWKQTAHMEMDLDEARRKKHPERYGAPNAPTGNQIPGLDDDAKEANGHLRHIRHSAERIASHFDARATAFGGGDIGRMGVFAYEMTSFWKRSGGSVSHITKEFGTALEHEMKRIAHEAFASGLKQGYMRQT